MDILSVSLTVFGAFGAGVTVGALALSPRLVTRTDMTPGQRPPVIYLVPDDPSPGLPYGYSATPGYGPPLYGGPGPAIPYAAPPARDSDTGQRLRSIMPPGTSAQGTSNPGEGQP